MGSERSAVVRPLRVVMATPQYISSMGGVEQHVREVAPRLADSGFEVTVLTTDVTGTLPLFERRDGVEIRRVRAWPARRDYYFAPAIYGAITSETWDILHVQSYHTFVAPLAMAAALRAEMPYLLTFHGGGHSSGLRQRLRPAQLLFLRPMLTRADRLIAVARFEIDVYGEKLRLPPEKFALIPNGSDLPLHRDTGRVKGLIASVGRLERYKGHHRVLAALPAILARRPDARLWIAGAGPYDGELRRLAAALGISDRVEISAVPPADRALMAKRLSQVELLVLMSEFETHPVAVLEALALGVRAVVSDVAGLRELSEQGLARAVQLDSSSEDLALAVVDELDRPTPPSSVHLRTWDECATELAALYKSVLATRNHRDKLSRK